MRIWIRGQVPVMLALVTAACASTADERIAWVQGNHVTVQLGSKDSEDSICDELWISGPGDIRVEQIERTAGERKAGSILLVAGRFIAIRGIDSQPGMEIDAMDSPALNWQLAAQLLQRAFPEGPSAAFASKDILIAEPSQGLKVGTMSAGGEYGAPWNLKARAAGDIAGRILFELNFSYADREGGVAPPIILTGSWEHLKDNPLTPGSMSLQGWKIFSLGPTRRSENGTQILDYGASSLADVAKTVEDLRELANRPNK